MFSDPMVLILLLLLGTIGFLFYALHRTRRDRELDRAIFSAVPSPRQAVDAKGTVLHSNPAFKRIYGNIDRSIPQLILDEVVEDEDQTSDLIERLASNAHNGQGGQLEVRVRAKQDAGNDISVFGFHEWRLLSAYPVEGYPGLVCWTLEDITSRRQVEQVIREEQDRFVDLLEHAPIGFYSVDEEGCFLFVNRTLIQWLEMDNDQLESGTLLLQDVVADRLGEQSPPHCPFPDPSLHSGEVRLKTASGKVFNASVSQEVVRGEDDSSLRTRSVVRNLSHERAMAEALERSEERFQRFFEEAPVGIALIDARGAITECNTAFRQLVGQQQEDLREVPLVTLLQEESRQDFTTSFETLTQSKAANDSDQGPASPALEVLIGPDGETICSLFITPLVGGSGAVLGFIAHFIDSTEQKKLEVQFAQSQKMQAVGQLAGGIAHDFNNLLTAMIGFSDLLLLRHRPGDQSFADIMQIKQNANRAANLVRQLLAFSRQQTLQPRLLNITDILAELAHLLRRLLGENLDLDMVHGRDLGMVKADQGQLEQVIINLAVNARDAMAGEGTLTISTSNEKVKRTRKTKDEVMPAGDYVLISVKDSGCGIAQNHLDRIFEPFFSTKQVGEGTGLGLSTVYGIVKQSGGYVFVESELGKGTAFSIYLPHDKGEAAGDAAKAAEATEQRDLTGKGRLLLVEDEDAVRSFGARALRNKGYEVLEANSGETAMEVLNEQSNGVDLIVTDVVMPRVDGPTLVKEVRQSNPEIKVIFISGYTEDNFRKTLDEGTVVHFLPKPFSLKQLAAKVKEVLEA